MHNAIPLIRAICILIFSGPILFACMPARAQAPVVMWKAAPAGTFLGGGSLKTYIPEQNLPSGKVFHLDANGNSYVAGSISTASNPLPDFITVKYDADGNELWRAVTDGYFDDRVSALAVDGVGNVYVLGVQGYESTTTFQSRQHLLLIKYAPDGGELWRVTSSLSDNTLALALDGVGNAYVSGTRPQGSQITFKFSAATGEMLWSKEIASGPVNQPKTLAVDAAGNCFVVANTGINLGNYNYVTVKYNADGVLQWRSPLTPFAGTVGHLAYALALDMNGSAYVAGVTFVERFVPSTIEEADFLVVKYGANGGEVWRGSLNTPIEYSNGARAIALDIAGNVVVSGLRHDNTTYVGDFITAKFDPSGNLLWQAVASEPGYTLEFWPVIAIDLNQNIYITGNTKRLIAGAGTTNGMTFKYNPDGVELWRTVIGGQGNAQSNTSHGIAVDVARNVYVAGNGWVGEGLTSAMTVTKYSQSGPTVPNPPTIASTTIGNGDVQLQFKPPVSNGGSPILQYFARCGLTNAAVGSASPLTVPGILPGVNYSCTVVAVNALGSSATSLPVAVKWVVPPSAPLSISAIVGDSQTHIGFAAPLSNGGSPILNFTATCNPGSINATGFYSPITISGLTNDQLYSCSVVATNSSGGGPSSDAVNVIPTASAPMILIGAESWKTHGLAGVFGIPLLIPAAITGPITVEPRMVGTRHEIAFRFSRVVTMPGSVMARDGSGAAIQATIANYAGNELRVALDPVANQSRISISLTGVNGAFNASASIGFLIGDVNNSYSVTAADISGVKANVGRPIARETFMLDLDTSGAIDASDVSILKARSGLRLP